MAETNGKPVTIPEPSEREPYRPTASTKNVYDTIASSMSMIIESAAYEARTYVSLFDRYDKDVSLVFRHQHLVDATECLELALIHLGQLKAMVEHRLRIKDEQNEYSF
jgi:hypothetical protein